MFEWTFPAKPEKSPTWYLAGGVVALALVVWGFFVELYVMSVVVILFVGVYLLYENNASETVRVVMDEGGVSVGDMRYEYQRLAKFLIVFLDREPVFLRLVVRGTFGGQVDLRIDANAPISDIRTYLGAQGIEDAGDENLSGMDKWLYILKV